MAWSDVAAKIKFWGVDGSPAQVNGFNAAGYGTAFSASDKSDILAALQNLYDRSATAKALLEAGVATRTFGSLTIQVEARELFLIPAPLQSTWAKLEAYSGWAATAGSN